MTIRIDVCSISGTHSATWHQDNAYVVRCGGVVIERGTAATRAAFDAVCSTHGIEPCKGMTQRRAVLLKVRVEEDGIPL